MKTGEISITRRIEFDAGHRVPDHQSQCRNIHGHRYALEVEVVGRVVNEPGNPENGMIVDFGQLKELMNQEIVEPWDHALLVARTDKVLIDACSAIPNHKTVILDDVPTVERLAQIAANKLGAAIKARYGAAVHLAKLRLYETPNCWADASVAE